MTNFADRQPKITNILDSSLATAEAAFLEHGESFSGFNLSSSLTTHLKILSDKASSASAAFTNVVTGLAIKAAYPDLDVRYHQIQIQDPQHFNHRGESENVIYPWLSHNDFEGAKSGWQTRTLERPKPYTLDYHENIAGVKEAFLNVYHQVEVENVDANLALAQLLYFQVTVRDKKAIELIEPKIDEIGTIVSFFQNHFFYKYKSRGASRLPVLALHSLYQQIIPELRRFDGLDLAKLELHSAADAQTGATGDIEIKNLDGSVFEAIEVKHNIPITPNLVSDVANKLISRQVERYYILTTHSNCGSSDEVKRLCLEVRDRTGCQIIANGLLPTLRYYLRLVKEPSQIFTSYIQHLKTDKSIAHEHRVQWNDIVLHSDTKSGL